MIQNGTIGWLRRWCIISCFAVASVFGAKANAGTVVAWGENNEGQATPPPNLTNVTAAVGGLHHAFGLLSDGTVAYWGDTNSPPPLGLNTVVALAAGETHCLALKSDSTVVAWGGDWAGQADVRPGLSNVIAVAAGFGHSLALKRDGTVVAWGAGMLDLGDFPDYGQSIVPGDLTNVVAIAAGFGHSVALTAGGRVRAWGAGSVNSGAFTEYGQSMVPTNLQDVVSIAASYWCTMALTSKGTVVVWGEYSAGLTNVPSSLTNVIELAGGDNHAVALKADGTVACWGFDGFGEATPPPNVSNIIGVGAFAATSYAVVGDGSPAIVRAPFSQSAFAGADIILRVAAVGQPPLSYQWLHDDIPVPGATNTFLALTNVPLSTSGNYECVVSNLAGSVTSPAGRLTVLRTTPYFDSTASSFGLDARGFLLPLKGLSGHGDIIISASKDFVNWEPILTNPPAVGSIELFDTTATTAPARFYRAVER